MTNRSLTSYQSEQEAVEVVFQNKGSEVMMQIKKQEFLQKVHKFYQYIQYFVVSYVLCNTKYYIKKFYVLLNPIIPTILILFNLPYVITELM